MGDRGDFEESGDVFSGGGYRPAVQRGAVSVSLDEFKAETPDVRLAVYATLALAVMAEPESLDDDQLLLLGYGMLVDGSSADMKTAIQRTPEYRTLFDETSAFLGALPNSGQRGSQMDVVFSWDRAVPERLQIPVTTVGLVIGFKGAVAAPAIGPIVTTATGGFTGGSTAATAGMLKASILAGAARLSGAPQLVRMLMGGAVGGSVATLYTGLAGTFTSVLSNFMNPGGHQKAEDEQAIVAQAQIEYAESTQPQGGPQGGQLPGPPGSPQGTTAPTSFIINPPGVSPQLGPVPPGSPLDPNVDLASQIAGWDQAVNKDDPLLRVPFDWPAPRAPSMIDRWFGTRDPSTLAGYRRSDVQETLANLSVGQLTRLQDLAVRSGLLSDPAKGLPNYLPGTRDNATEAALAVFMGQANIDQDYTWWRTAGNMARLGDQARAAAEAEEEASRPRYVREPFLKLDQASVRQRVDQEIERELGRPINDWEWTTFLNSWQQNHRKQYEQTQGANASLFEARYRESQSHTAQAAGTFAAIDPQARFDEQFQTMFAGELDRKKRTEQVRGMTGNLMQALSTAESAVAR